MDKQILIMELTSYCNSNCEDCLRAGMNDQNYMLPYDSIIKALNEIKSFSSNFKFFELKLSGGEPTIWKDDKYDITDVISECEKRSLIFSLISNGKVFKEYEYCKDFFKKLKDKNVHKLKIYITIDNFHKNYHGINNKILDNLLKIRESFDLDIYVQSTVTKQKKDNLSDEFIDKYFKNDIKFIMNPLLPWGKGEKLTEVVPYLNLNNNDKIELGDYSKYFYILGKSKNLWNDYKEYLLYNNLEALKKLNCCGKTITFMEDKYFYCMPLSNKKEFVFANLGELSYKKYKEFVDSNEYIDKMKNNRFMLNKNNKITPCGYGICGICRCIYEGGN